MVKREILQRLKGQLIISYQIYENDPLYGTESMVTMAKYMLAGRAGGIRVCWPENVRAVRALTGASLIGVNKIMPPADTDLYDSIFITPNYKSTVAVIEAGCDVVALDGALWSRNEEELVELVRRLKAIYPDIVSMADLTMVGEGIICEEAGSDILSSALNGYTGDMMHNNLGGPDIQLIRELKSRAGYLVNGEGKTWDSKQLRDIWAARTDMATMGNAIANPMETIAYLIDQMKK